MASRPRDFDWNLLKTFHAVARQGGVGAAARALGREQPSVSAALKRLEDHLGVPLCERSSRGIVLTPAGEATLKACDEVRDRLAHLSDALAHLSGDVDGTLKVRMISDVVAPPFDRAMTAFHSTYPRVEIRIDIAPWRDVLEAVRKSEVMLGVACDSAPSRALLYRPLIEESQQLYCGPGHRLFGVAPVSPESLADEIFVLTGEDEPDELARFRAAYGLGRRAGASAETLHEARKLIRMGFGIGFLPTTVAAEAGLGPALWPLLADDILPSYPLYVVTRRDAKHPPRVGELLEAFLAGCPMARSGMP